MIGAANRPRRRDNPRISRRFQLTLKSVGRTGIYAAFLGLGFSADIVGSV